MEAVEDMTSITDVIIEDNRRRHTTLLLSERGTWNNAESESKIMHNHEVSGYRGKLLKRSIKRSKSIMGIFTPTSNKELDTYKAKNIKQVPHASVANC